MSIKIFTWDVDASPTGSNTFVVRKAKFGDGYTQRSSSGLNSNDQKWSVVVSGKSEKIEQIISFIESHEGYKTFGWTNPRGHLGLYVCESFDVVTHSPEAMTLTCEFEQAFKPV